MPDKRLSRFGLIAALGLVAAPFASCTDFGSIPKQVRPLSSATTADLAQKGMASDSAILVRIFKEESALEVWKMRRDTGRFALFKTYDVCRWSGKLGPKLKEGDRQAPEGFYSVTPAQMNPRSSYHLSFNMGFPNAYDRALGRTGSNLMVHGACSSAGCYSMEDEQIQEIYTLARLAFQGGQRAFQIQAFPFRMTPENMARHRNDPNYEFWKMLKEGHDHFEVTLQQPKIDVCSRSYVFNAVVGEGVTYSPTAECPDRMSVPPLIAQAVAGKTAKDLAQELVIAAKLEAEAEAERAKLLAAAEREKTRAAREQQRALAAAERKRARTARTQAVAGDPTVTGSLPRPKPGSDDSLAYGEAGARTANAGGGNVVARWWNKLF